MTSQLEQQLTDALGSARSDERWALSADLDVRAVRRLAGRRRRRTAVATAAASVVVLGVVGVAAGALASGTRTVDRVGQVAAQAPGQPVAGISPAWTPASGRDWLLSGAEYDRFAGGHTVVDHPTGQSRVPSPAPLASPSKALLADLRDALPTGATTRREDAPGGDPDATAVHVRLADGTPVEVERTQLWQPLAYDRLGGDTPVAGSSVEDVPGTTTALLLQPDAGYGFPGRSDGAHAVAVVTRSGGWTYLVAPETVPLATVRGWALQVATAESH